MPIGKTLPKLPALSERVMVSLREGSSDVLETMASDAEYTTIASYIRGIVEREIATCRPEDFKRLRGVG